MSPSDEKRRGQILIMGVAVILVLGAIAMLTIDVGHIFVTRARLQNASDAAALAGLHVLVSERANGEDEQDARETAAAEAIAIARANSSTAGVEVQFGTLDAEGEFVEQDESVEATAVKAVVSRSPGAPGGRLSLFFGPLFGLSEVDVEAEAATSGYTGVRGVLADLSPFAVHLADIPECGEMMTIYDMEKLAPGCFGLLNFDGGPFSTPEAEDWILNGYDEGFLLDEATRYLWVEGGTGFRAALKTAIEQRIGERLTVCVYDDVTGEGHNTEFRIMSFLAVELVGCRLTGNDKYIEAGVLEPISIRNVVLGGATPSPNLFVIRLAR